MKSAANLWKPALLMALVTAILSVAVRLVDVYVIGKPIPVVRQIWNLGDVTTHFMEFQYVPGTRFYVYLYFPDGDRPDIPFDELREKITIQWTTNDKGLHKTMAAGWAPYAYAMCKGSDPLLIAWIGDSPEPSRGPCRVKVDFAPDFAWPKRVGMKVEPWYPSF